MKTTFSYSYMIDNGGCYSDDGPEKITELFFSDSTEKEISIKDILSVDIPLKDKYWFICRKCELMKEQNQQIAIDVAEIVLPIYEKKYPDNKSPREAIEAAKLFIAGHISLASIN